MNSRWEQRAKAFSIVPMFRRLVETFRRLVETFRRNVSTRCPDYKTVTNPGISKKALQGGDRLTLVLVEKTT
ncbi:MAG: hypothetical protein VKJ24_00375 [Synechococcales bacterium]|nr:hypothetical protein [Synechococcales bacterium]